MENIKNITVAELKKLFHENEYTIELDTPDGFQQLVHWFDKGLLPMVRVVTENYDTRCATNHMLQTEDNLWVLADELSVGDIVLTETGMETVLHVEATDTEECYDFTIDHPNHRYWGDGFSSHNSGKSLISGSIVKHAQEQGIYCVLIDTENALDASWLTAIGVDTDPSKVMRISATMIDDVANIINTFITDYKSNYMDLPREDRPKVLFVIDSLGMLLDTAEAAQFQSATLKGTMGTKAKQLKALLTNVTNMLGDLNIGLVCTNHSYANQDIYNGEGSQISSGGSGPIFSSSIIVMMKKLKLKVDADGNKTSDVQGIRAGCEVIKTRFTKPFEKIELQVPYSTGLSPYSGLFEYAQSKNVVTKSGNRWVYIDNSGTEHKYYEKEYNKNINDILDIIMREWDTEKENREQIEIVEHDPETGEILD